MKTENNNYEETVYEKIYSEPHLGIIQNGYEIRLFSVCACVRKAVYVALWGLAN